MKLIDTHAHLDFPYLHERIDEVLETAASLQVSRIVTIGASRGLESNYRALKIAQTYPDMMRCTAGIHPHDADMVTPEVIETLDQDFARREEVVAIGESGLDYHYNKSDPAKQRDVFRAFLRMSKAVNKPIVIHSRDAEEDTLKLLKEENVTGGILHCFTGSKPFAEALLEMDFYISFSGIVTFKSARDIMDIAANTVPDDKILVETDSPYLAPVPYRGKKNQPGYVHHTAEAIALARGTSLSDFAQMTWDNACSVLNWPE